MNNVKRAGADTNRGRLPEGQENDKFDGENFEERLVWGKLFGVAQLNIELDEAVHGNGYCYGFDRDNLRP